MPILPILSLAICAKRIIDRRDAFRELPARASDVRWLVVPLLKIRLMLVAPNLLESFVELIGVLANLSAVIFQPKFALNVKIQHQKQNLKLDCICPKVQ